MVSKVISKQKYKQTSKPTPKLKPRQQQKQEQEEQEEEVTPIAKYLKSPETARIYIWHFNKFLEHWHIKDTELKRLERRDVERKIIEYLIDHMSVKNGRKKSTVETAMAAIFSFCTMNDIFINKSKIAKLIPRDEDHKDDRAYTRDEIKELLRQSTDERFRAVIYLMANGMRVGAIPELDIGHLIPKSIGPKGEILDGDTGTEKLYQILVYNKSADHRHYMFCTPECRTAIDKYLESRKDKLEDSDKTDASGQLPLIEQFKKTSPLIREQFNKGDKRQPRRLTANSIKKTIERTIQRARLHTKDVLLTHGFRKWAITQMKLSKVDFSDREFLVGHKVSRGRDVEYDRSEVNERLEEWSKSINKLTIDDSLELKKKLQVVEGAQAKRIVELSRKLEEQVQISEKARHDYEMTRKDFGNYIKLTERTDEKIAQITQTIQKSKDMQEKFENLEKRMKELGLS